MKFEGDPWKIEGKLHKMSQDRVRFIPSRTIRSMIRHGRLDQLERFRINGVQAISVEGQETHRLGRIAWMVWTGLLIIHVESDHGANPRRHVRTPTFTRSFTEVQPLPLDPTSSWGNSGGIERPRGRDGFEGFSHSCWSVGVGDRI